MDHLPKMLFFTLLVSQIDTIKGNKFLKDLFIIAVYKCTLKRIILSEEDKIF